MLASLQASLRQHLDRLLSRTRQWPLIAFGVALASFMVLILTLRFATGQDIVSGRPSPRTINSPREISYESQVLTEAQRREAANDPKNLVYVEDIQVPETQRAQLQETFNAITGIRANPSLTDDQRLIQITELPSMPISPTLGSAILAFSDAEWQRVKDNSNAIYDRTLQDYTYSIDQATRQQIEVSYWPYIISPTLSDKQREAVLFFVSHSLLANRTLDEGQTQRRQDEARAAVAPVTKTIAAGQNLVRQGDVVTNEQYEALVKLGLITPSLSFDGVLGRVLLAILVSLALCLYINYYQSPLRQQGRALLVMLGLIIMPVLLARVFVNTWLDFPETFALAMIAVPLAALFNGSLALLVAILITILVGFIGDGAFQLSVISFAGAAAGVLAIRRADRAIAFLVAGAWITLAVFCTAMVWRLIRVSGATWESTLFTLLFSAVNGGVSALMAFGFHNVLGRVAGIVTPIHLLELAHPNQPLLRRLMQEAPGTYHHSIVVSNLAEQAAERVGADPLLTRVGAYYHDIGKMLRPYFFTDNQYDRSNVHDSLDPQTSAKLICDHIIEGAKTARKHKLPPQIVDFILEHHGTDVIKYFYQQALQSEDSVNIDDYRYPGPKPRSKETAILMLADGVEATVRSREQSGLLVAERDDDDTPLPKGCQTIAQVVDQSIDMRVSSGQLDDSPLTLRDLQEIRRSFVKTLQGIYHPRVEYPKLIKEMQEN
jgi:putative nucleotidyltransferase with HDIG domain